MSRNHSKTSLVLTLAGATVAGLAVALVWNLRDASRIPVERLLSSQTATMVEAAKQFGSQPPNLQKTILATLRDILHNNENAERRFRAALALHQLEPDGVEQEFLKALKDPAPKVRASVATSLGSYGYRPAAPEIIKLLDDPESVVRRSASFALGELKYDEAVARLAALFQDAEWNVRRSAVQALSKIGTEKSEKVLSTMPKELTEDSIIQEWLRAQKE